MIFNRVFNAHESGIVLRFVSHAWALAVNTEQFRSVRYSAYKSTPSQDLNIGNVIISDCSFTLKSIYSGAGRAI